MRVFEVLRPVYTIRPNKPVFLGASDGFASSVGFAASAGFASSAGFAASVGFASSVGFAASLGFASSASLAASAALAASFESLACNSLSNTLILALAPSTAASFSCNISPTIKLLLTSVSGPSCTEVI